MKGLPPLVWNLPIVPDPPCDPPKLGCCEGCFFARIIITQAIKIIAETRHNQ